MVRCRCCRRRSRRRSWPERPPRPALAPFWSYASSSTPYGSGVEKVPPDGGTLPTPHRNRCAVVTTLLPPIGGNSQVRDHGGLRDSDTRRPPAAHSRASLRARNGPFVPVCPGPAQGYRRSWTGTSAGRRRARERGALDLARRRGLPGPAARRPCHESPCRAAHRASHEPDAAGPRRARARSPPGPARAPAARWPARRDRAVLALRRGAGAGRLRRGGPVRRRLAGLVRHRRRHRRAGRLLARDVPDPRRRLHGGVPRRPGDRPDTGRRPAPVVGPRAKPQPLRAADGLPPEPGPTDR